MHQVRAYTTDENFTTKGTRGRKIKTKKNED